jgi:tetratricopeptide (TPR) repeat protein
MAVLIEAISVVVRREAVEARFAGGMPALLRTIPNQTACGDADLIRVGFMDTSDADAYVDALQAGGLMYRRDDTTVDLAVVIQRKGPTRASPWLEYADIETDGKKLSVCWLAGTGEQSKRIAVPEGWTYERSLSKDGPGFMSASLKGDRLKFLRREDGVDVYLDLQTNTELYAGRPQIAGETPSALQTQISAAFHEALAIEAKGALPRRPRFWQKPDARYQKLNDELLPVMGQIVKGPGREMAFAHFTLGVILRLLDRRPEAVRALSKARELAPDTVGILRDLVRCLGELGKPREALPYAREAAALAPTDAAELGNLAACLMQCGQVDEARSVIDRALEFEPDDAINQGIRNRLGRSRV